MIKDSKLGKIMCVDDSASFRAILYFAVAGRLGASDVMVLGNPQQALETAKEAAAEGSPFTAFVLDIEMAPITGLELARALRTIRAYYVAPIFFLTSTTSQEQLDEAERLGNAVIQKGKQTSDDLFAAISKSILS